MIQRLPMLFPGGKEAQAWGWPPTPTDSRRMIRLRLKCDGTRAETRFRLSAKLTSPFKSARASVQSTTGSRGVRISGSSAGYTMFRGSVKNTVYQLHSPVSPSRPLPCVTMCHHISTGLYSYNSTLPSAPSMACYGVAFPLNLMTLKIVYFFIWGNGMNNKSCQMFEDEVFGHEEYEISKQFRTLRGKNRR